eukprot:COSAG01_NODE_3519_length_5979_cov_340.102551_2_plen_96_part_00
MGRLEGRPQRCTQNPLSRQTVVCVCTLSRRPLGVCARYEIRPIGPPLGGGWGRCLLLQHKSNKGSASSANKISLGKYENSVCHVASTVAVKIDYR